MALARAALVVFLGGIVLAWVALVATSLAPSPDASCKVLGGPGIHVVDCPGFDPWTGQPHGLTVEYAAVPGLRDAMPPFTAGAPASLEGRRAIPLQVGFTIGLFITFGLLLVTRRRRNTRTEVGSRRTA